MKFWITKKNPKELMLGGYSVINIWFGVKPKFVRECEELFLFNNDRNTFITKYCNGQFPSANHIHSMMSQTKSHWTNGVHPHLKMIDVLGDVKKRLPGRIWAEVLDTEKPDELWPDRYWDKHTHLEHYTPHESWETWCLEVDLDLEINKCNAINAELEQLTYADYDF